MKLDLNNGPQLAHDLTTMPDVQARADVRDIPIQRVGIKSLRYPLSLMVAGKLQATVGHWTLDVALSAQKKGAHMSRLIAWLESLEVRGVPLTAPLLSTEIKAMLALLEAEDGRIEVSFPFFVRKAAPVSGLQSLMEYDGQWIAEHRDGQTRLSLQAVVPVKSLCPCSKEVSDNGAHNQRSFISMRVELRDPALPMDLSELVRVAEQNASSELWGLLKRADEKWVTEHAYANPKFVEDLIRDVAVALEADTRIALAGAGQLGSVAMDYLSPVSFRRIALRGTGIVADFDLIAGRYTLQTGHGAQDLSFPFARNEMFLAAMRDFLHLVAGRPVSDVEHLPRLDLAAGSCRTIARAWDARQFSGQITGDYA